jgi:hypothetical protein
MKQAKKIVGIALLICSLVAQLGSAQEDPNAILDQIRSAQAQIDRTLSGRLRPENGDPIPFQLQLKGPEFDYKFSNPTETIKLQLTDSGSVLTDEVPTLPMKISRCASSIGKTQNSRGNSASGRSLVLSFWCSPRREIRSTVLSVSGLPRIEGH